ncbi:MAG: dialkylresorcinol condensing enzyme [Gammaproteobacteria bacterium]
MHNILVVYYSQSGQLERVARNVVAPLEAAEDVQVDYLRLEPDPPYPFPWGFFTFLDAFPESVYLDPPALRPFGLKPDVRYDAIILAYTVWYLSPAPPITGFLKSEQGRRLLKDTPVITVTACRNMWLMAHEHVKQLLADAGARHCDHAALIDQGNSLATFFTTPRWMLTAKQDRWLGVFPRAGVSEQDIAATSRFGRAMLAALRNGELDGSRPVLTGLGAVRMDDRLLASERIARRSFLIWGRLLRRLGGPGSARRKPVLVIYVVFLVTMLLVVVPPSMLIRTLLRPFARERIARERSYFEQPSGSGTERINEFSA